MKKEIERIIKGRTEKSVEKNQIIIWIEKECLYSIKTCFYIKI